jgi:hypothetical protein
VLVKSWKEEAPFDQIQPKWKGPYAVIQATPMAVKVPRISSWIYLSKVKHVMGESTSDQALPGDTYSCKPIDDLTLFFWRNQKTSTYISKNFNMGYLLGLYFF